MCHPQKCIRSVLLVPRVTAVPLRIRLYDFEQIAADFVCVYVCINKYVYMYEKIYIC